MTEKKKLISLIAAGTVFVILLITYFAVIMPMMNETAETVPPTLLEGEVLGPNNRIMMFEHLERESIKSIDVHNEYGQYTFLRDGDSFVIDGYEHITYNNEAFSALVVAAGYTITSERITDSATDEEIAKYGLDDPAAYWGVTSVNGQSYIVNVGDRLVSGGGYYAMLEGRESCVYILSTSVENSILQPLEAYVNPILCMGLSESDYYTADNFTVMHGDEVFVSVKQSDKDEFVNPDAQAETVLMHPAGYKTDDTFYMSDVLSKFVSMMGEETVYIGNDKDEHAKYGLDSPYYSIYFTFQSGGSEIEYYIFVSERQEDGYYYAVSNLYNFELIARCTEDTFGWLEKGLITWVDDYPIALNILHVDSISVDTADGVKSFALKHGVDENEKATLEIEGDDGFYLSNNDVYNFRELYKDFLSIQIMGELDFTKDEVDEIAADESAYMTTITFNMLDGTVNEYSFYRYSTGRAILSANGSRDFYVYDDWLLKIESDVDKLLQYLEIDSHSKN